MSSSVDVPAAERDLPPSLAASKSPKMSPDSRLRSVNRLKKPQEFQRLRDAERKKWVSRSFLVFGAPSLNNTPRLGLTVKKQFGPAPCRNRFKRQVREYFRQNKGEFLGWDLNVVPRNLQKGKKEHSNLSHDLAHWGKHWKSWCNKGPASK